MATGASHFARTYQATRRDVMITTDRECAECGYLLRGLKVGGTCPECGTVIERPMASDDPLSRMPWRVIRVFMAGAWLAAGCVVLAIVGLWLQFFDVLPERVIVTAMAALTLPWIAAMWMLTPAFSFPEAQVRGFTRRGLMRRLGRVGQFGWALAAGAFVASTYGADKVVPAFALNSAVVLGLLAGLAGTILLAVLMENLCEWVRDDTAGTMFNWFAWTAPIALLGFWLFRTLPYMPLVLGGALLAASGLFPIGILMLTRSITYSWQHHVEDQSREERRAERARRDAERLDKRLKQMS